MMKTTYMDWKKKGIGSKFSLFPGNTKILKDWNVSKKLWVLMEKIVWCWRN